MALVPARNHKGQPRVHPYFYAASGSLYEGQLLEISSAGLAVAHTDGGTGLIIGVCAGTVTNTSTTVPVEVLVYDDPQQIFRATLASGTATITNIGNACVTSGNANQANNVSSCKVASMAATDTLALKIVGLALGAGAKADTVVKFGDITTSTTCTDVFVIINPLRHLYMNTTTI